MDAYRPPQYAGSSPTNAPPNVAGNFLFVSRDKRLPHVCLKCASTDKERIRFESKEFRQPSAGEKLGGGGGALGAVVASQFRHDIATAVLVATVVGGAAGGIVWLMARGSPRATVDIPLCDTCLERIANANSTRRMVIAGLLGGIALALFGLLAAATPLIAIGGLLFVGAVIFAISAKLPQWQFTCQRVEESGVFVGGVVPAALTAIAERAHKKKKKKKKAPASDKTEPEVETESETA
jgi:xanthosine utilization system XapX-like protein